MSAFPEIRVFDVTRNREGEIATALVCNGTRHCTWKDGQFIEGKSTATCTGQGCQGDDAKVFPVSELSSRVQNLLELYVTVPEGLILLYTYKDGDEHRAYIYEGGKQVTPRQFESGSLLSDGMGKTFKKGYGSLYYLRNDHGKAKEKKVCRSDKINSKYARWKLDRMRRGEAKRPVDVERIRLEERLRELMALFRTASVEAEIERVKNLLRLASNMSVESTIETAELQQELAAELADSRVREMGPELDVIERSLREEAQIRSATKKELEAE